MMLVNARSLTAPQLRPLRICSVRQAACSWDVYLVTEGDIQEREGLAANGSHSGIMLVRSHIVKNNRQHGITNRC